MTDKILKVGLAFYDAYYEKKKKPWQRGWFSQQIADYAVGSHSHGELVFIFESGIITACSSSSRDGGVRFGSSQSIFKNPNRWHTHLVSEDVRKNEEIWKFCLAQQGKPYDWSGVSSFKFDRIKENPNKWYCTELCQKALSRVSLFPQLSRIHPEDMYRITKFIYPKELNIVEG